jgi:hypothetical protein
MTWVKQVTMKSSHIQLKFQRWALSHSLDRKEMVGQAGSHTCMEKRNALLALHSEKIPNTYPVVGEETPRPPPPPPNKKCDSGHGRLLDIHQSSWATGKRVEALSLYCRKKTRYQTILTKGCSFILYFEVKQGLHTTHTLRMKSPAR